MDRPPQRARREHRRGARVAGRRLHARDDRVGRVARGQALHDQQPAAPGGRHRPAGVEPHAARTGGQGAGRRPLHRGCACGAEPAASGPPRGRPETGGGTAAVHADAGGGLRSSAGVRPLPVAGARSAAGDGARQRPRRPASRTGGAGFAGRTHRARRYTPGDATHTGPGAPGTSPGGTARRRRQAECASRAQGRAPDDRGDRPWPRRRRPGCDRPERLEGKRRRARGRTAAARQAQHPARAARDADARRRLLRAAVRPRAQGAPRAGRPVHFAACRCLHDAAAPAARRCSHSPPVPPPARPHAGWPTRRTTPTSWAVRTSAE